MAPHTPQRSERPGQAVALLDTLPGAWLRYNDGMRALSLALSLLLTVLAFGIAAAQQVDVTAPSPSPERGVEGVVGSGLQYEITQPDDGSYVPQGPRVHHDPAFIGPLSRPTQTPTTTGRVGLAGWTSPSVMVASPASGGREVTGYFALGFAFEWGGPPPSKRPVR